MTDCLSDAVLSISISVANNINDCLQNVLFTVLVHSLFLCVFYFIFAVSRNVDSMLSI